MFWRFISVDVAPPPPYGLTFDTNYDSVTASWKPPLFTSPVIVHGYDIIIRNEETGNIVHRLKLSGRGNRNIKVYNNIGKFIEIYYEKKFFLMVKILEYL